MKRTAIFLDRDGVLNRERGEHTWRPEDFEVLPGVAEAVAAINRSGRAAIVISNQSGIGLGLYTRKEVEVLHAELSRQLSAKDAHLDAILYCPHHPTTGRCLCRKPGGLLLERAIARYDLDPARSVMIGDRERDVQAANSVGVRGVLTASNAPLFPLVQELLLQA
ncbi:MAG TPA: HAD family hydrolase [Flavobacteriales bacterium]